MIVDIFSRKIVVWEVCEEENGEYAAEPAERLLSLKKLGGVL